jgi:Zn-dependent M28 family amino/carboxypeptidase
MKILSLLLIAAAMLPAQISSIMGARIRAHTKFLASDLLEGRGVGVRGGDLATEYLATELELYGAKPAGDNGTYYQRVPLLGIETESSATMTAEAGGGKVPFAWRTEFVGATARQKPLEEFAAETVFVGHGITAPEYKWDDYQDADVRGKVVVMFTNEPPSEDSKFFEARALTYYGRWTYKYEQALRKGAAGAIIIHTTPTAGYGWDVVQSSWGREDPQVKLAAGAAALGFAGWVSKEAGEKLLALAGHSVDALLKAADSRAFKPVPLGIRVNFRLPTKIRQLDTRNVVAIVPGSELAQEAVIFSAHWDHLGVGAPVNGDGIYNGAVDNATGCAVVLEIARAWTGLSPKPRRSAIFLFVTAEEGGLKGSEFYAAHPRVPASATKVALNYDALYPFGRTTDVVVTGAEKTPVRPLVEEAARRFQLEIKPDPRPEQGSYFRSDHFPLARTGIPAFSIKMGNEFSGKPVGYGTKIFAEYNSKHYHQPSDEYRDDWDFSGMEQLARFGFLIGLNTANLP